MPRTKRKDKSRAVLRTGESQRADGTYQFRWTDSNHKSFCVYAKTLDELRYKEEQIKKMCIRDSYATSHFLRSFVYTTLFAFLL